MKISPINSNLSKPSFNGRYVDIKYNVDIKNLSGWHKNSYLENTLGSYHFDRKNKVYFASPMEPISDNIKEAADAVVYDNEPSYPDVNKEVSRNYFGTERKNYKDDFEEIRQYYYRREMGGFASVAEAKYQQWQAAECARLYDKGGHLRYVKEQTEDKIKAIEEDKSEMFNGIRTAEGELKKQQEIKANVEQHVENLQDLQKPYKEIIDASEKYTANEGAIYTAAATGLAGIVYKQTTQNKYEDFWPKASAAYNSITSERDKDFHMTEAKESAKKEYDKLEKTTAKFNTVKENCIKTINELQNRIKTLKEKINTADKDITKNKAIIEDCKAKLIPIFDELKNFYAKQGIKVIKNV